VTARRIAVLGGAGGIGRALVAALREGGDAPTVLDLPASLQRHPPRAQSVAIDLHDEASVKAAFEALMDDGPLDGFVNLAGFTRGLQTVTEMSTDAIDDTLSGNLRGAFLASRAVAPQVRAGGSVVHVASGLAQHIRPGHGAYAAAKAGVIALTKTMAVELAPHIRVNCVAPGLVETAFLTGGTGRSDEAGSPFLSVDAALSAVPMGRHARPEDVVGPILFLLGPASAFMTGQVLWVNGGSYMP